MAVHVRAPYKEFRDAEFNAAVVCEVPQSRFAGFVQRRNDAHIFLMLAIPVLAGSAGYALGEAYKWPASLEKKPRQAPGFYLTIIVATVAGIVLNFLHIDPIRALFWAAVLNGVLAAPLMAVIMHMASSKRVMDRFTLPGYLKVIGWTATAVMLAAAVGLLAASG